MKKLFTFMFASLMLLLGTTMVNAQSKIPGELDLSTAVVDGGTGTLHGSAGWNGSIIDWMTKGNTATIQFENTQADTKYNIVSYGGTNQSQVVINFKITAADGTVFYDATTEPYAVGGFGDKKANKSLPTTNAMPAGNYTLVMTYDNLEEGQSLTVNISKIEFLDSEAQTEEPGTTTLGLNIPGVLDGSKATIEKNCSWGSTPSCDESNCFNWVGDGDVISFPITNTKTSAYAISFDTATPCEPVTIDFLITDANGQTVYGQTANVVCTGVDGGDWAFKPEGHNTSLPNTDVLPAGNYTLKLTFHQGTNYENFTTNVKDITFTAVAGGDSADSFDVDLSTVDVSESQGNKTLHYMGEGDGDCPRLDYPSAGDVAKFNITLPKASAYQMSINYATPMTGMFMTWTLTDASGNEVYNEMFNLEPTGAPGDFWTIYTDFDNIPQTAELPAGDYTLRLKYNIDKDGNIIPGSYDGSENANFHVNIKRITFTAVGSSTGADFVFLHGENFDKELSTNDLYQFKDAQGFTLTMNNRDINRTPCNWTDPNGNAYTDGINFKNNDPGTINIPEGLKVTKLEIGGCSQSDASNLCYLYSVVKDGVNFFTDGIGQNVTENSTIQSTATYPITADGTAPLFATLDFSAAPATQSITVVFSGNNQEDVWFKVYYNNGSEEPVASQTIYSWTGGADGAAETGGKATATEEARINYSNSGYYTISINKNKTNVETDYVLITLDQALQAGDEIAITAYRNKDTDANGTLYMLFENGAEIDEGSEKVWNNIHADYAQEPNTRTYTVSAEAGSKSFKIVRSATGTNVFITKLVITRGGTTGIETVETVSTKPATNIIYNLRGQRVDASYKGIVIMNGKKFIQK